MELRKLRTTPAKKDCCLLLTGSSSYLKYFILAESTRLSKTQPSFSRERYMPFPKNAKQMRIGTWNIDRLRKKDNLNSIVDDIQRIDADILILTEFDKSIKLPFYKYNCETQNLPNQPYNYHETERRVSIFSKFPITQIFKTYDPCTSCCVKIETPTGNLIVYGTIVGIIGKGDKNFHSDLDKQIDDINCLSNLGDFCYVGDLNTSFCDSYYVTKSAREKFLKCFKRNNLKNMTENISNNIDHIIISKKFVANLDINIKEWNSDKLVSDHKGICITMRRNGI